MLFSFRSLPNGSKLLTLRADLFWKRYILQGSQQEGTKVIFPYKNGRKSMDLDHTFQKIYEYSIC